MTDHPEPERPVSLLDEVEPSLHRDPMSEAVALGRVAARVGFDWAGPQQALKKVEEEIKEIEEALRRVPRAEREEQVAEELGDLLFAACMVARLAEIDPGDALRRCNAKFRRRFALIELELERRGLDPERATLDEMEAIWRACKAASPSSS